jgi:DNA-binding NarL/FixJ family response regulator
MITIVIADDQALIREGLRMILEAQPDLSVIGEAEDGEQAVAAVHETSPTVVLMDVRMPRLDGIEATRQIAAIPSCLTQVLVLTTFDQEDYAYQALAAGAAGFIVKSVPPARMIDAVRIVSSGDALVAPRTTRGLIEAHVRHLGSPARHSLTEQLTPREIEIVELVARGRSNAEIAEQLVVTEATVKSHVSRVLAKLGLRDRVQIVVAAYETGLVTPGSP